MLTFSMLDEVKFPKVYEFCEKNFEKPQFLNLLFSMEYGSKVVLNHSSVCNKVINLFMETFTHEQWKLFFFQLDHNNATIILSYLNNNWIDSAKILIEVARQKLMRFEFWSLMYLKDKDNNCIVSVKNQKNLHDIDTSVSFCTIL